MNKAHERRVNSMKRNSLTSPFAKAYEKLMDYKILRELAFPLKSPVHMAAAINIGPRINDSNNLSSVSNRYAGEVDEYFRNASKNYKNISKILRKLQRRLVLRQWWKILRQRFLGLRKSQDLMSFHAVLSCCHGRPQLQFLCQHNQTFWHKYASISSATANPTSGSPWGLKKKKSVWPTCR